MWRLRGAWCVGRLGTPVVGKCSSFRLDQFPASLSRLIPKEKWEPRRYCWLLSVSGFRRGPESAQLLISRWYGELSLKPGDPCGYEATNTVHPTHTFTTSYKSRCSRNSPICSSSGRPPPRRPSPMRTRRTSTSCSRACRPDTPTGGWSSSTSSSSPLS